jgi:hypothetical protein
MWTQLEPHLDYVEQIYFAGGEPLLMEEHYRILDELVRRKRFDVRLIYNTNFTHTDLKGNSVFEYWKQLNPNATEQQQRDAYERIINPYERSYASGMGAGQARIATEQGLNPILNARKVGEVEAVEGTATGQAELKSAQLEADKAQNLAKEEETRKAKQIELSRQTATLAKEIANSPNLGSVTGFAAMTPTINPESQDLIIKAQQLLALLTADNLKLMSGVLTDKDIEMLQTLSSGMKIDDKGIKGSELDIRQRLVEIATNIEKTLAGKSGASPSQQQQPAARNESDIMKEYGL